MKEWNGLLKYIDSYIYMDSEEEIVIRHGKNAPEAVSLYEKIILEFEGDKKNNQKWIFDIALDCVRKMSDQDREYVCKHMQTTEYHFGYAMGIRNQYIHPSKKHRYFDADGISSQVMRCVFTIVSPIYDYRNSQMREYYEDFSMSNLIDLYGESQNSIFAEIEQNLAAGNVFSSSSEAITALQNTLREALGPDEFINALRKAVADFEESNVDKDREKWYWETNFPSCKAPLYKLQSNQMNTLRNMGLFGMVERRNIKNVEECRKYIDENIGLREDYAEYMARCIWEVFNPVATGKWKTLGLYNLDIGFSKQWKIEALGIENLGDLHAYGYDKLLENAIELEVAEQIRNEFLCMGILF